MKLREWLAVPYGGPGRKRAAIMLWLRDVAERLEAGDGGALHWRWRLAAGIERARRWTWHR